MTGDLYVQVGLTMGITFFSLSVIPLLMVLVLNLYNFVNDIKPTYGKGSWDVIDNLLPYTKKISCDGVSMLWLTGLIMLFLCLTVWPVLVVLFVAYLLLLMLRMSIRLSKHVADKSIHGGSK